MTTPLIVFDVNETLSDLSPLADRFVSVGAPAEASSLWFASVLRDGFALSVAGVRPSFLEVAREVLRAQFSQLPLEGEVEVAVDHVLGGFAELSVHADVVPGVRALADADVRMVTLTNGATAVAERLLTEAGLIDAFDRLLSVDDAPAWKPSREAYAYAARQCGVDPADMILVASHPWDVDGAVRAGLGAVWVDRRRSHYPQVFTPPTHTVTALDQVAEVLS